MRPRRLTLGLGLVACLLAFGCSGDDKKTGTPDVQTPDSVVDGAGDVAADLATPDVAKDGKPEVSADVGLDTQADVLEEVTTCQEGEARCSDDGLQLETCTGGQWVVTECMREMGQLCESGACVDPWRYGNPTFDGCADHPAATPETMAQKAAYFDELAPRLLIHPKLQFITHAVLPQGEVPCENGEPGPCLGPVPSPDVATHADVIEWHTGENDGLWSSLYMASQAYRYAVTKSPEALDVLRVMMEGEETRMRITGVPGVFTRQYIAPDVPGIACPAEDSAYIPDIEKDDNKWVKVKEDGCVWIVDRDTLEWTKTDHCGLEKYAGYCWLDNVSQDEYAGHIFALGSIYKLVDDPEIKALAGTLLTDVARHLVENDLVFVDWDGRGTEHGYYYATSMKDTPGFAAIETFEHILAGAVASDDPEIWDFYNNCLLQKAGPQKCLPHNFEQAKPYTDYLDDMFMYMPPEGCKSNWNNMSMMMAAFHVLIWFDHDPETRKLFQDAMDREIMRADNPRAMILNRNAWYNFIWASQKTLGPGSDGPAYEAVKDAVCGLRQFPARKHPVTRDSFATYPHDCDGRLDESLTNVPIPVAERCLGTFLWWGNPYRREQCTENLTTILQPGDYLLAYWMGRYFGFVQEGM